MKTTIDTAGRIVVPKAIRDAARMEPGTELEVRLVGDVIELTPVAREVRLEKRGQLTVAVPIDQDRELTQAEVEETLRSVREGDLKNIRRRGRKGS